MTETPYARAWREFQDSHEGLKVLAAASIGVSLSNHKSYVNRIKQAFEAGWNASHRISANPLP